jgi:hypothetical protein
MLQSISNFYSAWNEPWNQRSLFPQYMASEKTGVLKVNFCIPAKRCINSCRFSICCSRFHSLFKKSWFNSNGQVLAENELSVCNPWGNFWCIRRVIRSIASPLQIFPPSSAVPGGLCACASYRWPLLPLRWKRWHCVRSFSWTTFHNVSKIQCIDQRDAACADPVWLSFHMLFFIVTVPPVPPVLP